MRPCAKGTCPRSTARCWTVCATTPPTAAGTWARGEAACTPRAPPRSPGGGGLSLVFPLLLWLPQSTQGSREEGSPPGPPRSRRCPEPRHAGRVGDRMTSGQSRVPAEVVGPESRSGFSGTRSVLRDSPSLQKVIIVSAFFSSVCSSWR